MRNEDIIRAWKDDAFREGLSDEEQTQLPESPAGLIALSDDALDGVDGAAESTTVIITMPLGTYGCCIPDPPFTYSECL